MRTSLWGGASVFLALLVGSCGHGIAQSVDSDHDGMSDGLEQALLVQFAPTFLIGDRDCSDVPAEFRPVVKTPEVENENGTIYGQVSPAKVGGLDTEDVEIHYYHLWRTDCGKHGHPLDTEHVAVLVRASRRGAERAEWKRSEWRAIYWYAAAHENTVCDVSQIARASTLHAEDRGAKVWISPGKHASYLNGELCRRGCGADKCERMVPLTPGGIVNLGEVGAAMNESAFIASTAWPLAAKMSQTNFPAEPLARLEALPDTDIAWFNAGRHPAQQIISISSATEQSIAGGGHNASSAISLAGDSTGNALSTAQDSTGNALGKSYRKTKHALGSSARHVGEALHVTPTPDDSKPD
jgi:hypothetical protein